jgi:hypothetical protein
MFSADGDDDNDGTGPHKLQNASNVALPPRSRLAFDWSTYICQSFFFVVVREKERDK